jgi:hypothetical protein
VSHRISQRKYTKRHLITYSFPPFVPASSVMHFKMTATVVGESRLQIQKRPLLQPSPSNSRIYRSGKCAGQWLAIYMEGPGLAAVTMQ